MRTHACIGCSNVIAQKDTFAQCDLANHPDKAPSWCPEHKATASGKSPIYTVLTCLLVVAAFVGGFSLGGFPHTTTPDTAIQIASQTTVLFPSTLAYVQQTALTKGTGLANVDFIYVERQTGIDALTLMAIAAHESAWGSNAWAVKYNNIMSWGISDSNPSRYTYQTKTLNVLAAAQGLKRLYLSPDATYYGGSLTLWGVNKYYASDKGWADGVNAILKQLEAKLTEQQQMQRWMTKTELFAVPVTWDYEHIVTGWVTYKANIATAVAGR